MNGGGSSGGGSSAHDLLVFGSASTFAGNFGNLGGHDGGLEAADYLCQLSADSAQLGGTWTSWLSTSTASALSRITVDGGWALVGGDGGLVFANRGALTSNPMIAIDRTEMGEITPSGSVWTGTLASGQPSVSRCSDWTTTSGIGTAGITGTTSWTNFDTAPCTSAMSLYCFQTSLLGLDGGTGPVPFPTPKRVFVTSGSWNGNLRALSDAGTGPEAGDQICNQASADAGLGGTWQAWLSATGINARGRFTFAGPWVTVGGDGGIVFASSEALRLLAPTRRIDRNEFGNLTTQTKVWTATRQGGTTSTTTCTGWTASMSDSSTYGNPLAPNPNQWSSATVQSCSMNGALYCFEQ